MRAIHHLLPVPPPLLGYCCINIYPPFTRMAIIPQMECIQVLKTTSDINIYPPFTRMAIIPQILLECIQVLKATSDIFGIYPNIICLKEGGPWIFPKWHLGYPIWVLPYFQI